MMMIFEIVAYSGKNRVETLVASSVAQVIELEAVGAGTKVDSSKTERVATDETIC